MAVKSHYLSYVSDEALIAKYSQYQAKYTRDPRESDKLSIQILKGLLGAGDGCRILDVACSTGNFVRHLRRAIPAARLVGSDLSVDFVDRCRADESLRDIEFRVLDCLSIGGQGQFDAITANAVTCLFNWADYRKALSSISDSLKVGGYYVGFEWISPFAVQDLTIVETNEWNPDGLTMYWRPMAKVESALRAAGFSSVEFRPFVLPIDLPFPGYDEDVVTYTRKDEHGERMAFRGVLFQPWCHLIARK